jgi:hypothetical protein
MQPRKLSKLKLELAGLRRSQAKARDLGSLATRLGRKKVKRPTGKEPLWESVEFPNLNPLSIPHHGNRDIPVGTKNSILAQLEEDVAAWEMSFHDDEPTEEDDGRSEEGNGPH